MRYSFAVAPGCWLWYSEIRTLYIYIYIYIYIDILSKRALLSCIIVFILRTKAVQSFQSYKIALLLRATTIENDWMEIRVWYCTSLEKWPCIVSIYDELSGTSTARNIANNVWLVDIGQYSETSDGQFVTAIIHSVNMIVVCPVLATAESRMACVGYLNNSSIGISNLCPIHRVVFIFYCVYWLFRH